MSAPNDGPAAGEQRRYDRLAARFWDPRGPMRALHTINPMRAAWLCDRVRDARGGSPARSLAGLDVLDVGCAVGLLSEALARQGGKVTGIDVAAENIRVAEAHARGGGLAIAYRHGTLAGAVAADESFDVVACLEVVEHVDDLAGFLGALARTVRPDGLVFVSSIARTSESLALAKIGAEYVLRILPPGTHRWADFRNPGEVGDVLVGHGFRPLALTGMAYLPLIDRAWWQRGTRVNWMGAWQRAG